MRARRTKEWVDTSIAIAKPSGEVSTTRPWRSSRLAKAMLWIAKSSLPCLASIWAKTSSMVSGLVTSRSSTSSMPRRLTIGSMNARVFSFW